MLAQVEESWIRVSTPLPAAAVNVGIFLPLRVGHRRHLEEELNRRVLFVPDADSFRNQTQNFLSMSSFNELPIRSYLGLDADAPGPSASPVEFLSAHLRQLPPHLLLSFSVITTPKDRTQIAAIRNRRLKYADTDPPEFQFASARSTWPLLYEGQERRGRQEGEDEKDWVARDFLQGLAKHVGHLGTLLGGYEEEVCPCY
jgi:hypothetical protein